MVLRIRLGTMPDGGSGAVGFVWMVLPVGSGDYNGMHWVVQLILMCYPPEAGSRALGDFWMRMRAGAGG